MVHCFQNRRFRCFCMDPNELPAVVSDSNSEPERQLCQDAGRQQERTRASCASEAERSIFATCPLPPFVSSAVGSTGTFISWHTISTSRGSPSGVSTQVVKYLAPSFVETSNVRRILDRATPLPLVPCSSRRDRPFRILAAMRQSFGFLQATLFNATTTG